MKDVLKVVGICFGVLLALFTVGWMVQGNEFFMYKFFAPKQEAVRRQVFEQTYSYRRGVVQELQNMQMEYAKGTPSQRDAMASIILHRAADFPEAEMPSDLRVFIADLRHERTATKKY
jgi:hypothetical protein